MPGLEPGHSLTLVLNLFVKFMTHSGRLTSMLIGAAHLLVFGTYVMLIFD